ncbi:sigma 54 modulation/S30EA ribosomal C-terminal domain-containing protein [Nocardia australiensis]|uniref:sigma 54 modulation/S30EA ribosomal C-terminal domain-containing protein n=1 Tax=Nocardia australiensis TaxID=2887191 RepID=UPI001D15C3EB|nr:sigma 54 modulation/S30EA ribosomal C-terminal domain-containing protein [Nocardia australiensis]
MNSSEREQGSELSGSTEVLRSTEVWATAADPELAVTTRGQVPPADVTRAVRAIGRVLRRHHVDTAARVRVTQPADAAEPTLVQANIRFHNTPTRVQVTGPRGFAVTFAVERLDRQIARLATKQSRSWPDPARPPLARITESRPIVRRKQCALLTGTPAEATAVLDAMDYDAYLFTDSETGEDAIVHWAQSLGVRLTRQRTTTSPEVIAHASLTTNPLPLQVDSEPARVSTEDEAAQQLCRGGLPFLFFTDADTARGRLLYRRYDGDLTIVVPAGSA